MERVYDPVNLALGVCSVFIIFNICMNKPKSLKI